MKTDHKDNPLSQPFVVEVGLNWVKELDPSISIKHEAELEDTAICVICGLSLNSQTALYYHIKECKKRDKVFKCAICGETRKGKKNMRIHLVKHTGQEHCTRCSKIFPDESSLIAHKRRDHWPKGKKIGRKNKLANPKQFECHTCQKVYTTKSQIILHVAKHMLSTKSSYFCDMCSKSFREKRHLYEHIRRVHSRAQYHDKKLSCPICSKKFRERKALEDHQHVHTGVKAHLCNLCGSRFASTSTLQRHMTNLHSPRIKKPKTQCEVCGSSFARRSGYLLHLDKIHGDGKLECQTCGKRVYDEKSLEIHMNAAHRGIKPYKCDICGGSFSTLSYLKVHLRIHTGESFQCDMCPRKFNQTAYLTAHYRLSHPEKLKTKS